MELDRLRAYDRAVFGAYFICLTRNFNVQRFVFCQGLCGTSVVEIKPQLPIYAAGHAV
jgi:hypothetical protein